MIVDDHAEMRRLLRSMFSELTSEITECADGAQAVAAFARHSGLDDYGYRPERREWPGGHTPHSKGIRRLSHRDAHSTRYPADARIALEAGACAFVSKENLAELRTILQKPT